MSAVPATSVIPAVGAMLTGSMTAAMVAHPPQSCVAFAQILLFGRGDTGRRR